MREIHFKAKRLKDNEEVVGSYIEKIPDTYEDYREYFIGQHLDEYEEHEIKRVY